MKHRSLTLAGAILVGTMFFGAQHAAAVPPAPDLPTEIANPTALPPQPEPPEPQIDLPATDIVAEEPCWELDSCQPEPDPCDTDPTECEPPTEEPPVDEPEVPTDEPSTANPTSKPVDQPRPAPAGVPTPNRIDTGAGPADQGPVNWWLVAGSALALIVLAGAGAHLWIRRTDRVRP